MLSFLYRSPTSGSERRVRSMAVSIAVLPNMNGNPSIYVTQQCIFALCTSYYTDNKNNSRVRMSPPGLAQDDVLRDASSLRLAACNFFARRGVCSLPHARTHTHLKQRGQTHRVGLATEA